MKRASVPKTTTHNKLGKLWFFSKKVIRAAESTAAMPPALKPDQTIDQPEAITAARATIFPPQPGPEIVKSDPKKTLDNIPAEIRRLPSVHAKQTASKVTDPSKPPSSTITKLQALSASGIGSVHHPTTTPHDMGAVSKQEHSAPETDLRSMLNRLDTPAQNVAEESPAIAASPESNPPIQSPAPESKSSLFGQSVDQQMDEIFAKIAPIEAQQEVTPANKNLAAFAAPPIEAPVEQELAKPAVPETTASPATEEPKLFQSKVDDQIEELFSEIVSPQAQREVTDFVAEQNAVAQGLKDFGRLSSKASEGAAPTAPLGTMKTIGKLLIDSQDVDNIIKKAQAGNITVNLPSARVISAVRGEGIQALLDSIDNYNGVAGSMLVGGDGLVIASTYTTGGDRDSLGVLGHGIFGNSNLAMLRLDLGKLDQMIFVGELTENENHRQVTTILTDVEVGTLAVFVDSPLVVMLEQLLEQLSTIARG